MKRAVCLRLLIVVLALLPLAPARADSPAATRPAAQPLLALKLPRPLWGLDTDGEYVMWALDYGKNPADRAAYTFELYASPAHEYRPQLIKQLDYNSDQHELSRPALDGGIVVWAEYAGTNGGESTIYGYDLHDGREFEIARARGAMPAPEIEGQTVAWVEPLPGTGAVLRARNTATMAEPVTLAELQHPLAHAPQIGSDYIVWGVWSIFNPRGYSRQQLFAVPRAGGSSMLLGEAESFGTIAVAGSTLAYVDQGQVVIMDLGSGGRQRVSDHDAAHAVSTSSLITGGRYTFWIAGAIDGPDELWAYDQLTGARFVAISPLRGYTSSTTRNNLLVLFSTDRESDDPQLDVWRISDLGPSAPVADPQRIDQIFFSETRHTLGAPFRGFWETQGSLPVFGYPSTEQLQQRSADTSQFYTVQYVERQRFEHHPEHAGTPYEVQLGRLGDETLKLMGRDWQTFPKGDPAAPHFFSATGHTIAPEFWTYWSGHGLEFDGVAGTSFEESLALFGMPLSEPALETNSSGDTVLTQWFERARFEYHAQNPDPYKVLLGRLAADMVARAWPD